MGKFVKLGPKANSFADPVSGFSLRKNETKELGPKASVSPRVKRAISQGHLVVVQKEAIVVEPKGKFAEMTKAELVMYYEETFDVTEVEVEVFSKKPKSEMLAELKTLESE